MNGGDRLVTDIFPENLVWIVRWGIKVVQWRRYYFAGLSPFYHSVPTRPHQRFGPAPRITGVEENLFAGSGRGLGLQPRRFASQYSELHHQLGLDILDLYMTLYGSDRRRRSLIPD